jgi:thymidylate kinase
MNIIEAYTKFNEELIIIISGLSGSGKSKIASFIERDFKIKKINIESFCVKKNDRVVILKDKTSGEEINVTDWDHIDTFEWSKINEEVNKYKGEGVVVYGPYFPLNHLKFSPNFHIHVKISKQKLIENRHEYIKSHPDECKELFKLLDTPFENMIINQITYPHYLKYLEESGKNIKYINTRNSEGIDLTIDQVYDQTTDYLFNRIQEFLNDYNKKIIESKKSTNLSKNEIDTSRDKRYKNDVNDLGEIIDSDDVNDVYNLEKSSDIETITTAELRSSDSSNSSDTIYLGTTY